MHLARLSLDLRSAQARRDLSDPYEMHRTLVRPFVRSADQSPPRILWRLERSASWGDPVVLVQSSEAPDWSVLGDLPNYLKRPVETRHIEPENLIQQGATYRFRLAANPTVSRNGKRLGLVSEQAQLDWLKRQGDRHGFVDDIAMVTASEQVHARKGDGRITVLQACFEGRLSVTDDSAMRQALLLGIGPAKALGCGLMSLART